MANGRGTTTPPPSVPKKLGRAFLRHAFNQFYHDFSNVDTKKHHFLPKSTYYLALLSFVAAVRRRGQTFKVLAASRHFTSLPNTAPEEERERFKSFLRCEADGSFSLSPSLLNEVDRARTEAIS